MSVRLQTASFDPGAETNAFLAEAAGAGAAVTFTGLVRSRPDDPVSTLTLEVYPELAEAQLSRAIADAGSPRYSCSTMPLIITRPMRVSRHTGWISCRRTARSSIRLNAFGNCCVGWRPTTNTSPRWMTSWPPSNTKSCNSNIPMKPSEPYAAKIRSLCIASVQAATRSERRASLETVNAGADPVA